jgi:hypothetical protein
VLGVLKPFTDLRLIATACERLRSYLLSEEREGTMVSSKKVSIFGFAIESLGPPGGMIPRTPRNYKDQSARVFSITFPWFTT